MVYEVINVVLLTDILCLYVVLLTDILYLYVTTLWNGKLQIYSW